MGYFAELAYRIDNCIVEVRFSVFLTVTIDFLVLKQIFLGGNTKNYAQNTSIFIARYGWNTMRANLKYK